MAKRRARGPAGRGELKHRDLDLPGRTLPGWTNKDSVQHTGTADDGSFDSGKLASGSTFSQTFSKPGTYAYHCTIHSSMKATITVS